MTAQFRVLRNIVLSVFVLFPENDRFYNKYCKSGILIESGIVEPDLVGDISFPNQIVRKR